MTHRLSCLFGSTALAALLSLPAVAQEYSNGGKGASGRKPATLTPVEAFGVHPPGLAPADAGHWKPYVPYYAPLSPVASSTRWRPWSYHFLWPYYTPYYRGYSPHRLFSPRPRPYGSNGWGSGPEPDSPLPDDPDKTPLDFGPYTSVVEDDTTYWNMGGNGLAPYDAGLNGPVGPPDLIDAIQASRPHCRGHVHFHPPAQEWPPAVVRPAEAAGDQNRRDNRSPGDSSRRRARPAEPIPPGKAYQEQEEDLGLDRSSLRTERPGRLDGR